jgi:hypothetical protein
VTCRIRCPTPHPVTQGRHRPEEPGHCPRGTEQLTIVPGLGDALPIPPQEDALPFPRRERECWLLVLPITTGEPPPVSGYASINRKGYKAMSASETDVAMGTIPTPAAGRIELRNSSGGAVRLNCPIQPARHVLFDPRAPSIGNHLKARPLRRFVRSSPRQAASATDSRYAYSGRPAPLFQKCWPTLR